MPTPRPLRSTLLRTLIVSVFVSGVLGVIALLGGRSSVMAQVLFTSLCGTAASLLSLIGAMGLEHRGRAWWGLAAIGGSLVGFGLWILGIWVEFEDFALWRLATTGVIVGATAALAVLLGLARLPPQHEGAAQITRGLSVLLGALLVLAVWGDFEGEGFYRITAAIGVLVAAGMLLVPVLARLSRTRSEGASAGLGARASYCPACGQGIREQREPLTCGACGRSFRVTFEGEDASPFQ